MSHKRLSNKPVLLFGNKQDVAGAVSESALGEAFGVGCLSNVVTRCCTMQAKTAGAVDGRLEEALSSLFENVKGQYSTLQKRVADDLALQQAKVLRKQQEKKERVLKRQLEKAFPAEGEPVECWS